MIAFLTLLFSIALAEGAGALGALFTTPAIPGWYAALLKPALTPPSWVFGPVWSTLYLLIGIAAYLVWRARGEARMRALYIYALQLALNLAWSLVFFGMHSIAGGFAVIVLLWLAIALTIYSFAKVSRAAAWLLAPYLLWVSFAAYLNFMILHLN